MHARLDLRNMTPLPISSFYGIVLQPNTTLQATKEREIEVLLEMGPERTVRWSVMVNVRPVAQTQTRTIQTQTTTKEEQTLCHHHVSPQQEAAAAD